MKARPNGGAVAWLSGLDEDEACISVVTIPELRYDIERLACGRLVARSEGLGQPIEPRDAFIAATAEVHGLTLVTRNASDFQPTVKSILTPSM